MISHCVDEATRWSATGELDSKTAITIIYVIALTWLRLYGAMRISIADQERDLMSDEAAQWMDHWNIQMRAKEPGAHANIVERHHDLLRRMLLRVETQLADERMGNIPFSMILAECTLAKNLLLSVVRPCTDACRRSWQSSSPRRTCSWRTLGSECRV